MLERDLESRLNQLVKLAGGVTYKLDARTHKGAPDRVVILDSTVWFIELKTETGKLSELQGYELDRLNRAGANTRVIYGVKELDQFFAVRDWEVSDV